MFGQDNQSISAPPVQDPGTVTTTFDSNNAVVPEPTLPTTNDGSVVFGDAPKNELDTLVQSAPPVRDDDTTAEYTAPPAPVVTPLENIVTAKDSDSNKPFTIPTTDASDDLQALKQKALESLTPLVGHLDQTPEEKFRTTMMMIQANDNKDLLPEAYAAAQSIIDEKVKAQALLDVINEINYFSQPESRLLHSIKITLIY